MWKIPLTGRGLEIKHLAMWMCLTLNKKPWFVKMPQLSDRVELQLKEALEPSLVVFHILTSAEQN